MTFYKKISRDINVNGKKRKDLPLNAEIFSYDEQVAKFVLTLINDIDEIDLSGAEVLAIMEYTVDGVGGSVEAISGIESVNENSIYFIVPEKLRGFEGSVTAGVYVNLSSGEKIDIQNLKFKMSRSLVDSTSGPAADFYFESFDDVLVKVKVAGDKAITDINSEAQRVSAHADQKISEYDAKFTQSDQKMSQLQNSQTALDSKLTETQQKITDADVFTKQESSANVINSIGGAESTILKKELLIDGTEGTGGIDVRDWAMYSRNYAIGTSEPRTLVGNGSSQAAITTLYQLSDKLIGKEVTISFDLEKTVGTTGQRVMVAVDKTWQNMATINIADVPENGKKRFTITATISAADNGQKLYMQSQPNSAPHLNGSVTISDLKIGDDDNWSPAPEDTGMVGFSHKQYELMNSPDGIVRAETLVSDRGAGIDFEIPVMETFEKKYSYLFIGLTTTDEKIAKYKELVKSVSLLRTDRGSGISNRTNVLAYFSRGYFKYDNTYQYFANYNGTNELKTVTDKLSRNQINKINSEGKYCFRIASANNEDTSQTGVMSNGIVSAFVEVKDIKLIIELESNGRTIIESFIAAYHIQNVQPQITDLAARVLALESKSN